MGPDGPRRVLRERRDQAVPLSLRLGRGESGRRFGGRAVRPPRVRGLPGQGQDADRDQPGCRPALRQHLPAGRPPGRRRIGIVGRPVDRRQVPGHEDERPAGRKDLPGARPRRRGPGQEPDPRTAPEPGADPSHGRGLPDQEPAVRRRGGRRRGRRLPGHPRRPRLHLLRAGRGRGEGLPRGHERVLPGPLLPAGRRRRCDVRRGRPRQHEGTMGRDRSLEPERAVVRARFLAGRPRPAAAPPIPLRVKGQVPLPRQADGDWPRSTRPHDSFKRT